MSEAAHDYNVPKGALIAAAAILSFTIAIAAMSRLTGIGYSSMTPPAMVESLDLNFEDGPDGTIMVYRAEDHSLLRALQPNESGFVRVVMHGLARERQLAGIGRQPPFQLARYVNGQYTLTDPSTKKVIDLGAFGADNRRAFARLMPEDDGATKTNNDNNDNKGGAK
jgi:putative photosynthetic complex assembly protein